MTFSRRTFHNTTIEPPHSDVVYTIDPPWLPIIVLMGGGAYFFQLIQTGDISYYVNIRFLWIAWIGMYAFFLLALAQFFPVATQCSASCCQSYTPWKVYLLAFPIALGLFLPSVPLNSSIIRAREEPDLQTIMQQEVGMQYLMTPDTVTDTAQLYSLYHDVVPDPQRSSDDPLSFTMIDWFRIYADLPNQKKHVLDGAPVNLVGFVHRTPTQQKNEFMLSRFFMRHCMFDTIPLGIPVRWNDADTLELDAWVQIEGTLHAIRNASGTVMLHIAPHRVVRTQQPSVPYLYATESSSSNP